MKKNILLILLLTFNISCSSLKKSVVWGGVSGASIGAVAGSAFSPDKYSRTGNSLIFGGLGALIGAGLGWMFFKDDPENRDLPSMILERGRDNQEEYKEVGTKIIPKESKIFKVQNLDLPLDLKRRVEAPTVIEHIIPEREEKTGSKSLIIQEHKAWEVLYE